MNRRKFVQCASGLLVPMAASARGLFRGVGAAGRIPVLAGVPSNVQIILQGGATQGQNEWGNAGSNTITDPNSQTIGFQGVPGASSYNIYRSTTTTPGTNGAFSLYASVSATTAASNYSTYVANATYQSGYLPSGYHNIAPGIDCVYTDTAATTCVDGTYGPTSGYYYGITTGYSYYVTAVVGGVESSASATSILPFFLNGVPVMCDGAFNFISNLTFNSANPNGALSPAGFSNSVLVNIANYVNGSSSSYVNPFAGGACVGWALSVTAFNYFNINIYPVTLPAGSLEYETEIADDLFLYTDTLFPTLTAGVWTNTKLPLSTFMLPGTGNTVAASAVGVRQISYYKTTWSNAGSAPIEFYLEAYFSVN